MKTLILSFALVFAAGLLLLGSNSAHAGPRVSSVLVLPNGSESVDLLLPNAADSLRDLNVAVTKFDDATLAGFDFEAAMKCLGNDEFEDCSDVLDMVPAEWVLLLSIRRESDDKDSDLTLIVKMYSTDTGDIVQVGQRSCGRCSSSERMANLIRELVTTIVTKQLSEKAQDTFLDIRSSPPRAILRIDGVVVGTTGQAYRVTPGEHHIKIEQQGYRNAAQTVNVAANEHKALTISLDPTPTPNATRRLVGWVSLGSGVVALGLGATMIALDESAPAKPLDGTPAPLTSSRRNTKGIGIAGIATGAVLAGVGTYLLLTSTSSPQEPGAMALGAAPNSVGGFSFSLSGHF